MCDLNVMCTWPAGVIAYGSVCKRESIFVRRKENLDKVEVTVGGPREEEGTTVPGLNCHARCRAWWSDPTQTHTETQKNTLHISNNAPKAHNMYRFLRVTTRSVSQSHTHFYMLISWSALGLFVSRCEQTDHWPPGQFKSLENSSGLYVTAFLGVTSTPFLMWALFMVIFQWRSFCLP